MRFAEADDRIEAGVAAPPVRRASAHPGRSRAAGPSSTASRAVATSCAAPAAAALAAVAAAGGAARRALRQRARPSAKRVGQQALKPPRNAKLTRATQSQLQACTEHALHATRAPAHDRPVPRDGRAAERTAGASWCTQCGLQAHTHQDKRSCRPGHVRRLGLACEAATRQAPQISGAVGRPRPARREAAGEAPPGQGRALSGRRTFGGEAHAELHLLALAKAAEALRVQVRLRRETAARRQNQQPASCPTATARSRRRAPPCRRRAGRTWCTNTSPPPSVRVMKPARRGVRPRQRPETCPAAPSASPRTVALDDAEPADRAGHQLATILGHGCSARRAAA